MKRLLIITLMLCAFVNIMTAQRITHNFQNVSMSNALKYVQQQTSKHKIVFIYNELEDYKVTTSVHNKSVPDAIKQLIGFYPIRMTQSGDEIYVECTHKSDRHLTGRVVDEKGLPLEFADVRLLNSSDSSYITGGVTNASGVFVIPLDQPKVIAKFSYIGYKPVYKLCSRENVGTIQLEIEATQLGEVTVKGERIFTSAENGHTCRQRLRRNYSQHPRRCGVKRENLVLRSSGDPYHQRQTYHTHCRTSGRAVETNASKYAGKSRVDAFGTAKISYSGNGD